MIAKAEKKEQGGERSHSSWEMSKTSFELGLFLKKENGFPNFVYSVLFKTHHEALYVQSTMASVMCAISCVPHTNQGGIQLL